jgi:hypothetical protein
MEAQTSQSGKAEEQEPNRPAREKPISVSGRDALPSRSRRGREARQKPVGCLSFGRGVNKKGQPLPKEGCPCHATHFLTAVGDTATSRIEGIVDRSSREEGLFSRSRIIQKWLTGCQREFAAIYSRFLSILAWAWRACEGRGLVSVNLTRKDGENLRDFAARG